MPDVVQSLWIGPRLSTMERLCISSFLRNGHPFHLYVYQDTQGVPPETVLLDANEILPASKIFMYREVPSYAGFANFFRYKLLLEKGGWFVDADTVCLKPFEFQDDYVFSSQGEGGERLVNVAAIKAPVGSGVMQFAWDACQDTDVTKVRWGQTGPELITRAVERYALQVHVRPPEVFCPVHFNDWERVLDPSVPPDFGPTTYAIHLWNEMWRRAGKDKDRSWPPHCLYEQLKRRYIDDQRESVVRRVWTFLSAKRPLRVESQNKGAPKPPTPEKDSTPRGRKSSEKPLKGLRIAATLPPRAWFGGIDYNFAEDMRCELVRMGAQVFSLPIDPFVSANIGQIDEATCALRSFRPDVAISLANAGHSLLCTTPEGQNVFRDVLEIPTLMLWDHGPLQFSRLLLGAAPSVPSESNGGCIEQLRQALDHPLYIHYSPDRGHIATLDKLGVLDAQKVHFFLQPAYPCYVRHGYNATVASPARGQIAFAGNVYIQGTRELTLHSQPALAGIYERVFASKKEQLTTSLWDLVMTEIDRLNGTARDDLRLVPQSSFFWSFVHDMIEVAGNTEVRLAVLNGLKRSVDFYGNFMEPDARSLLRDQYRIRYNSSLDCLTELPLLYANCSITVDVINLGYNTGSSPKVTACLAAGGLPLFDYKPDFHQSLGEAGDQLMYRSIDHLNAMTEDYLANPRKRREVIRGLQDRVRAEFTFSALTKRFLVDEPRWRNPLISR